MKVEKLMTPNVRVCAAEDQMSAAVKIMWDADCGIVPVVDKAGHVVGVITDRDICIACWSRDVKPSDVRVGETMTTDVKTCTPGDTIVAAEKLMEKHQIRRLPVTDAKGKLVGIISMNDISREAEREHGMKRADIRAEQVVEALAAICRPRAAGPLQRSQAAL
jgi:CBS domain-containing protein